MCKEHERQSKAGSSPHPRCGHGPDDDSRHPRTAQFAGPDIIPLGTIGELPASSSAADGDGSNVGALTAGLFAAGHGPGRNPWWVNLILAVLLIGGLVAWRIRAARKNRSLQPDNSERASER